MRVTATITQSRTVSTDRGEYEVDEETEVVGDVEPVGDDEAHITIISVDGLPPRGLAKRERDEMEERLWLAFLEQTERREAQGVAR